jgi:hypothetical protein
LNYGPGANDSNFTNYNCGSESLNYTLGFNFLFQNIVYNNVQINAYGFVSLNNTAFIYVYFNSFCTNGSGSAVFYREIDPSSPDLNLISARVISAFTNYSTFVATNALVVTWFNVRSNTAPSQLNTFQMIIATDNISSFVLYYYVRLDSPGQIACLTTDWMNSTGYVALTTSLNCSSGGSWVELVNTGGNFRL